jgi:hypothetical protein
MPGSGLRRRAGSEGGCDETVECRWEFDESDRWADPKWVGPFLFDRDADQLEAFNSAKCCAVPTKRSQLA